jgi:hypothetical protein
MKYVFDPSEQGTDGWRQARAGRVTGSMAACVTAKDRSGKGEGTTRRNYRVQLVAERLSGEPCEEGFMSKAMQDGKENEPDAILAYEAETGNLVESAGFAYWPDLPVGCSPDGLVECPKDGRGFIEAKCPTPAIHIEYLTEARLPPKYVPQTTHNGLVLDDYNFVDFISFCPRLPEKLRLFVVRVYRTEFALKEYEPALMRFLEETAALEAQLRKRAA